MSNYLITGGCGFIGSHLAEALTKAGHQVTIIDNLSSGQRHNAPLAAKLIIGDILDAALMQKLAAEHDVIVHLAAIASVQLCREQWLHSHQTNVTGSITVLEAAAKATPQPKLIYASSAAIYGDNNNLPLSEDAMAAPQTSYGLDKYCVERYAALAFSHYGLRTIGLRFFNVYGARLNPDSPYSGVISKFVAAARHKQAINIFGAGDQTRDFIYIDDIVRLIIASSQQDFASAAIFNGCTGSATSLIQLVQILRQITGAELAIKQAPARLGDIKHSLGNPDLASKQCNFIATTTIIDGLRQLISESAQTM